MATTREQIDSFIKTFIDNYKEKKDKEFDPTFDNLYKLGKIIENQVSDIIDSRNQKGKDFKYVAWKWYEYILRKFDKDFWFELSDYSQDMTMVKMTINWFGKQYSGWYGVEDSPFKTDPRTKEKLNERVDNKGEKLVNEGMRGFAKVASRATGLFYHLWIEGGNN